MLSNYIEIESSSADTPEKNLILSYISKHPCNTHPFFHYLENNQLSIVQATNLLRNYDAHASSLRRLLLKTVNLMPEEAVGFILENVRNEYGNGNFKNNHQDQLRNLAWSFGIKQKEYFSVKISKDIAKFITLATSFYYPKSSNTKIPQNLPKAAIAAGAITGTELLAIKEFYVLQKCFAKHNLGNHVWFEHINIEKEHTNESLDLALFFCKKYNSQEAVLYGLSGILEANIYLYDGLLNTVMN